MSDIKEKITRLKSKYDETRTKYAVANEKRKAGRKQLKELGIDPDNADNDIEKLEIDLNKKKKKLTKLMDTVDETIKKSGLV